MEITFWGVRGSTPCANKKFMKFGGNTTCVQIDRSKEKSLLILDSGTGIRNLGNSLVDRDRLVHGHLFVTHPHWDHLQGFPFFKPIYDEDASLKVHLPRQPRGTCKQILAGQMTETYFPVTPDMLHADIEYITQPKERQIYDGFSVEFMLANHHTNTAIYKFHFDDNIVVFAPDNEVVPAGDNRSSVFTQSFRQFVDGADVLIHDAQYNRDGYQKKRNWGHSAWEEVVEQVRDLDLSHLLLTHHDPDASDDVLTERQEIIEQQYKRDFESIRLAHEQLRVSL